MKQLVRLALLAGAAYLLARYWRSGRSPLLAAAAVRRHDGRPAPQPEAQREDAQHAALEPLGGLHATTAGQTPLPRTPELETS